jgi:hypothetical protein
VHLKAKGWPRAFRVSRNLVTFWDPFFLLFPTSFSACLFSGLFDHLASLVAPLWRFCGILDGFQDLFWFHFGILLHTFDITFSNFVFPSFADAFFFDLGTPGTSKTMLLLQ